MEMITQAKAVLKQYYGHDDFRPGQEELIAAILQGQDVLGVMPTGAGKSVCYQIPALLLPGLTLVISPLISLMKDQVAALVSAGVRAAYLNTSLSPAQRREVLRRAAQGAYKLLYVAPERLLTEDFRAFAAAQTIPLLAVDEAHCVSQWGQDFRPSYLDIARFVAQLQQRPVLAAFTATATAEVRSDVIRLIGLRSPRSVTTGFDRPNLRFAVERPKDKTAWLKTYLREQTGRSGIVYCATRKTVDTLCETLRRAGFAATRYHAGLEDDERRKNQDDFAFDRATVIVATNAFGMGIDKSNVSFVVHYNMPKDVESYYQEAGRAGRDGAPADCVLLFSESDIRTARYLIEHSTEETELDETARRELISRNMARLHRMADYCKTTRCLRATLLRYFGEAAQPHCDNCANCAKAQVKEDITIPAQKILSCVRRAERQTFAGGLGASTIIQILRGSRRQKLLNAGFDRLPTFGILQACPQKQLQDYVDALLRQGYLESVGTTYPILQTTERANAVLFGSERVELTRLVSRVPAPRPEKRAKASPAAAGDADEALFERLKALRLELARQLGVPAYVVFPNSTLLDMAAKQPETMPDFLQVSGVGSRKAEQFGAVFLAAIRAWKQEQSRD